MEFILNHGTSWFKSHQSLLRSTAKGSPLHGPFTDATWVCSIDSKKHNPQAMGFGSVLVDGFSLHGIFGTCPYFDTPQTLHFWAVHLHHRRNSVVFAPLFADSSAAVVLGSPTKHPKTTTNMPVGHGHRGTWVDQRR